MKKERKGWGGKREGAGRPRRFPDAMKQCTVTLPPAHIEALKRLGDGNLSKGIRRLVASFLSSDQ